MKKIIHLFLGLLIGTSIICQETEIALKEYFADAEFFLLRGFYEDALHDFMQVYKRGYEENANINYRIGICYLNIPGQKHKAIEYLLKAKEKASNKYVESSLKEENAPIDVYLYLGNAYRINDKLDEAINAYSQYKELIKKNDDITVEYANKQIEACQIANQFMSEPENVVFTNMGSVINNTQANYKAILSGDGNTIVFMNSLPFYEAVYFSQFIDNKWTKPVNITPQIMSDGDQFVSSISYDGTILLLTKEDEFNSDIYISFFQDGRWIKSEALGRKINTKYWESHACLSKDGKTLYFTSNRRGGFGEMDVYKSVRQTDGTWGEPVNLGENINTPLNEDTPFITMDGNKLFFSSQSHMNMGGYDVFYSERNADSSWSSPQNMRYPVNTTDDDLNYFPWRNGEVGYIAKINDEGFGHYDIYRVEFPEVPVPEETIAEVIEEDVEEEMDLQEPKDTIQEEITTEEKPPVVTLPIVEVNLGFVLFEFDRSRITEGGKVELDKALKLLNSDSEVTIHLVGHTDALGPSEYNLKLSERRAKAAQDYLLSKGVNVSRITIIGKGEEAFVAINKTADGKDSPEGRKYNRRVEIEIKDYDTDKYKITQVNPVPEKLRIK